MIEKGFDSEGKLVWLLPHINIFTLRHTFLNPIA